MTFHAGEDMTALHSPNGRLFVLDLSGSRVFSLKPDGSDSRTLVTSAGRLPDGVVVDVAAGHLYWTNMGIPDRNDGSIERTDLDGRNRRTIVPEGGTHTPKQLHLEKKSGKLYWCDREGMRVMRANLDGSRIETLVQTGEGDADSRKASNWCVGIAVDADGGQIYWTQKGADNAAQGRILRAGIETPKGQTAANRSDITVLFDKLPEPIDLEIDVANRVLYWTDRGNPPRGNSVSRTPIDGKPRQEIVLTDLMEGIGVALDVPGNRMFVTDLAGTVYAATLDGKDKRLLAFAQGNLSGIAYAELPSEK
jgi:sugar lactone lactonase YvrE